MQEKERGRLCRFFLGLMIAGAVIFSVSSFSSAFEDTYTVQEGDTLWSICETYYGDANLWPKLWEMNPFITNPHFLRPGDRIRLLERAPVEKPKSCSASEPVQPEPFTEMAGINVSSLTTISTIGRLSREKVQPWGTIFSSYSSKLMMERGDRVVVHLQKDKQAVRGDRFTVYEPSDLLRHPLTGEKLGYILDYHGTLEILKHLKKNYYEAKVINAIRTINVKDPVIPYEPISPCIQPLPAEEKLIANIVAVKDQNLAIGQNTIVYLNKGFNQGIRRGNLFEVLNIKKVSDSDFEGKDFFGTIGEMLKSDSLADIYSRLTKKTTLFEDPLGTLLILESRPDTSTGIILTSRKNLLNGSFVRALSWTETPPIFSKLGRCALK
ncbi:MAG: LysM peptidoglycan-binding domain-containing protein [Deltaproteobacteria bacterium]|nr:LysM peptidoglycan-binding domain-containing protein [Deltaproteobacteria bacterium]MBW2130633.1 LysM peptidoglycan-binding domain-containing protein [Deltaproteobacteria bacterium]